MSIAPIPGLPPDTEPLVPPNGRIGPRWREYLTQFDDRMRRLLSGMAGPAATTVAKLPSAATLGAGARGFVTDATATTFHSTVAGGGSNKVPVVSDGANWLIG